MENSFEVVSGESSLPLPQRPEEPCADSGVQSDVTEESVVFTRSPSHCVKDEDELVERLVGRTVEEVLRRHDETVEEVRRLRMDCCRLRTELELVTRELELRDLKLLQLRLISRELCRQIEADETEIMRGSGRSRKWRFWERWSFGDGENVGYLCWSLLAVAQTVVSIGIICAIRS